MDDNSSDQMLFDMLSLLGNICSLNNSFLHLYPEGATHDKQFSLLLVILNTTL